MMVRHTWTLRGTLAAERGRAREKMVVAGLEFNQPPAEGGRSGGMQDAGAHCGLTGTCKV